MVDRATKLRWRRRFRRSQQRVENLGVQAEEGLERHFFGRLNKLVGIRRFVVSWVLLLSFLAFGVVLQNRVLSSSYQVVGPVPGGIYNEGVLGTFTNANPLYATGSVDAAVSHLIFSGLMKYDSNNHLVGDLASSVTSDDRAEVYTATLRPNIYWHDDYPVTAQDVVYTYKTIQNPDTRSPLLANWEDVKIEAKDTHTIVFTLPHGLASFPNSLTTGILPRHLLKDYSPSQLRAIPFNTVAPVGTGPYKWQTVEVHGNTPETRQEQIGLVANDRYYAGEPKIPRFTIHAFHNQNSLTQSFNNHELTAIAGFETAPDDIKLTDSSGEYNIPLTAETMIFMKNAGILQDSTLRQALTQATNAPQIVSGLGYPVIPADAPLLKSMVGYQAKLAQLPYNLHAANTLLDKAGWKVGADGIRSKAGQRLTFNLLSESTSQYSYVTQVLQKQWRDIGVDLVVTLQSSDDLQNTLAFHNYDALLFGISLGTDPDVFAYWHSSQADIRSANRLNFSEYKSTIADRALEAGRSRTNNKLREAKYEPFLRVWRQDAPAVALYQPRFLYITRSKVYNFEPTVINDAADRYSNVQNWMIREAKQDIQ